MKHIKAIIICILIYTLMLFMPFNSITGISTVSGISGQEGISKGSIGISDGYRKAAESEMLVLYYNSSQPSIAVEDKKNGFLWNSSVSKGYYNKSNMDENLSISMNALFSFAYTDYKTIVLTNSSLQKSKIKTGLIKNGIGITYHFTDIDISMTIKITLEKDVLKVSIPINMIKENGKWGIVRAELMPFFGAAGDFENGYVLYPDGCGALYRFKGRPVVNAQKYSWHIYGENKTDLNKSDREDSEENAMLPVFGMKKGVNAFIGIISKGEYDALINFSPSGYIYDINRISPEFIFRRIYSDARTDVKNVLYIEKNMVMEDREIEYVFLNSSKANYSGMANAYRNYLTGNKMIERNIETGRGIPLGLDLFMGIKEERILFDKFIAMTDFKEARMILNKFISSGVDKIDMNLIGWSKNGYGMFPDRLPASGALGGSSGLKELLEYSWKNGVKAYLQVNFTDGLGKSGGFSKRNDVVYNKNQTIVTDDYNAKFLLNPYRTMLRFETGFLPGIEKYRISGLNFEQFGESLYGDYQKKYTVTHNQTVEYWSRILVTTRKQFGHCAVTGGNAWTFKYADRLYDIPVQDSGCFITDESIPFYQMVIHGLIPYSSEPGNLFYDFSRQKLKWVEYGCMPYFKLTYKKPNLLKNTDYSELFTSCYIDWIGTASEIYKEFNERLKNTWGQIIVEHIKLQDDVYRVTYGNGTAVYVNYKNQPVHIEGFTIGAMDYLVVSRGESN